MIKDKKNRTGNNKGNGTILEIGTCYHRRNKSQRIYMVVPSGLSAEINVQNNTSTLT